MLGTALLRLKNDNGILTEALRALCDSGSQVNLISKECFSRLGISCQASNGRTVVTAFGTEFKTAGCIDVEIFHATSDHSLGRMRCYIVPTFTSKHPQLMIRNIAVMRQYQESLADPTWDIPASIDILIGAGSLASLTTNKNKKLAGSGFQLILQGTSLGWIASGEIFGVSSSASPASFHVAVDNEILDSHLRRLWEVENPIIEQTRTPEENLVENNFSTSVGRDSSGRYIITMALRKDSPPLGLSRHTALKRLIALEARCKKDPDLAIKIQGFFEDYQQSGHMVAVGPPPTDPSRSYYVPYHAIQNKKFRVVFDGSCPSSTGVSVNDLQFAGPKIQSDICEILLRFRTYRYALSADIVKMFRQVLVHQSQWDYQRILWRPNSQSEIRDYAITRVVWGYTSASYNAIRSLRQCATDYAYQFPLASTAALSNFYVDDLLSGTSDYEQLIVLREQLVRMLEAGGFPLAKWITNDSTLASEWGQKIGEERSFDDGSGVLGMTWNPTQDTLSLRLSNVYNWNSNYITKRELVSRVAQVYDPSGLFAPIVVTGKIIIQDIWRLQIGWDNKVPDHIAERFSSFHKKILELSTIKVPRWLRYSNSFSIEWHTFSDASEFAFGACVYLRTTDADGLVACHLVQSRSRVAPVKLQTIPRLELMGAQVAVELWEYVSHACQLGSSKVTFWTDLTIVLAWLRRDLRSLKPFVANRVSNILKSSTILNWRHVPGTSNPADLLSRGTTSSQLRQNTLWWNGPSWLLSTETDWPAVGEALLCSKHSELESAEIKANFVGLILHSQAPTILVGDETLLQRASTSHKLSRVTAFVLRFIRNISKRNTTEKKVCSSSQIPAVTVIEREAAIDFWIREEQQLYFRREVQALLTKTDVPSNSTI